MASSESTQQSTSSSTNTGSQEKVASGDVPELFSHTITWTIDNHTDFTLMPIDIFAQWGNVQSHPNIIYPQSKEHGGLIKAGLTPWIGAAGIVGYKIQDPPLWFGFLGSNPDMKAEDNKCRVILSTSPQAVGKDWYNEAWKLSSSSSSQHESNIKFANGKIFVKAQIGAADDCTATFSITFDAGA